MNPDSTDAKNGFPLPDEQDYGTRYPEYGMEQVYRHIARKRPEREQQLYIIADELLFNVWDPLCLSIDHEYREEYLPYLPHTFDLLVNTKDGLDLYDYLVYIEEIEMHGIEGDTVARRRASRLVNLLLRYRKSLFKDTTSTPAKSS
ncbi:MAG: hypothetical protein ACWGOX_16560 [Desulforhopalus sp.]